MSDRFEIKENEHGIVRLFTVDLPEAELDDFAEAKGDGPSPLQEALGVSDLNTDFVELFPVSALEGLGLTGYMVEGLGIAEADVNEDRARLEAIEGPVLVVLSSAFGGTPQTLTPKPPLRWVGTYTEERAAVNFKPLPAESAKGTTGGKPPPSDAAMSGRVASIALLVLFLLVAVVVWVAA
jgi:hypothetical protein